MCRDTSTKSQETVTARNQKKDEVKPYSCQPESINLEVYNMACQIIMKTCRDMSRGLIPHKEHEKVVADAYKRAEELFDQGYKAARYAPDGSRTSEGFPMQEHPRNAKVSCSEYSPVSSGYVSEEESSATSGSLPATSYGTSSGVSSGISSGVSSGSVPPSPSLPSIKEMSFGSAGIDFVFNTGTTNAPTKCHRTTKVHLSDGSFEMIIDYEVKSPVQKIKVFTLEELDRQASIVAEFKKKVLG
uniref:Non-specific serine/threonine protein kinase n=1 Tax=Caenorhabditis tropicalis TaxID=1561998 RepID=A0A1I7UTD7_9PELO